MKLAMGRKSEDLSWPHHTLLTTSMLTIITVIVSVFILINFSGGNAFFVVLSITGGVAGMYFYPSISIALRQ